MNKLTPIFALSLLLLMLLPDAAQACPVCFNATDENRQAFLGTTIFLSLFPLGMVAGVGLWIRKRSKELNGEDIAERASPEDGRDATG